MNAEMHSDFGKLVDLLYSNNQIMELCQCGYGHWALYRKLLGSNA